MKVSAFFFILGMVAAFIIPEEGAPMNVYLGWASGLALTLGMAVYLDNAERKDAKRDTRKNGENAKIDIGKF